MTCRACLGASQPRPPRCRCLDQPHSAARSLEQRLAPGSPTTTCSYESNRPVEMRFAQEISLQITSSDGGHVAGLQMTEWHHLSRLSAHWSYPSTSTPLVPTLPFTSRRTTGATTDTCSRLHPHIAPSSSPGKTHPGESAPTQPHGWPLGVSEPQPQGGPGTTLRLP